MNTLKEAFSVKFDATTAEVIEELRKKPTGGKEARNRVITELIESNPKFISMLKQINKNKSKKDKK